MKQLFIVGVCMITFVSCSTQKSLYSWYNSEETTYNYTKRGTDELLTKAMEQYEKVISKQKGMRGIVPPGANAEYGYLLYKAGKKEEGLALLKAEIEAYPESEKYISRIINQLEK